LGAGLFFAAGFFAAGFFAAAFFAAGFFAGLFFAAGFFAGLFFAAGFFAGLFFAAGFFAGLFFAAGFFAAAFFFFAAMMTPFTNSIAIVAWSGSTLSTKDARQLQRAAAPPSSTNAPSISTSGESESR
jgi:hypothetical protein